MNDKNWSEGVARWAVKYSAKLTYAEAREALLELAQIEISDNSVWRLTQHWGEALKRVEAQEDERANGTVESQATGKVEAKSDVRLGASMDGTMIYIRGEAWKELKVGCFFEVEPAPTLDPETMDWIDLAHARKNTFVSHLGGPETFGQKMWTESKRRCWHNAVDTQVVGDGAVWIWNLVSRYYPNAVQIVDWYHAEEHLETVAAAAFADPQERSRWLEDVTQSLWEGQVELVINACQVLASSCSEAHKAANYFYTNAERMRYDRFRSAGFMIGSGSVESACKQIVTQRLKLPGAQWIVPGAVQTAKARAAWLSGHWQFLCDQRSASPLAI